jgi:hypothetical protein
MKIIYVISLMVSLSYLTYELSLKIQDLTINEIEFIEVPTNVWKECKPSTKWYE